MTRVLIFLGGLFLSHPGLLVEAGEKVNPSDHDMVLIAAGSFQMGAENNQGYQACMAYNKTCKEKWFNDEQPVHTVKLDGFYIDIHEVTQAKFQRMMGGNPSEYKGSNLPVDSVTWFEAKKYCEQSGKRLPTEAEWERAAKAGTDTLFIWGNNAASEKANFCDAHCKKSWKEGQFNDGFRHTAPVGSFAPNAYGLFDMAGNVYEWVADWYEEGYYQSSPKENPQGPESGKKKVMRGGSWVNYSTGTRPADRTGTQPNTRKGFVGFRCAL